MRNSVLLLGCALARLAAGQPATLELRVTSAGEPVYARVYIHDAGGRPYTAPGAVVYARGAEEHSIIDGAARIPLSPGRYRIRVEKGPEYAVKEESVWLEPGKTARLDVPVARLVDMNAEGWYSGDLHIHRAPGDMAAILRAEDLNVGPVITRHVGSGRAVTSAYPQEDVVRVDARHVVGLHVQEVERNFQGHGAAILLNTRTPLDPKMPLLFPTVASLCRRARAEGGFVDAEKPMWRHVPVSVAFGLVDSIGVVNNHFHPHEVMLDAERLGAIYRERREEMTVAGFAEWMMGLYYSFLNCGYRIAASAGSASGVMPSWPGYERVYVDLSGPFSYEQWFRDLRAGRSVATNGPLLRVKMDGRPPGSAVEFQRGMTAELEIRIDSQDPLERVEIVANGKVVRKAALEGRRQWRSQMRIAVNGPGWMAVRCFEPAGETLRFAHSSPFYFTERGALPVRAADARRWAEFIGEMIAHSDPGMYPSRADFDEAMAEYREAERIYGRRAEEVR